MFAALSAALALSITPAEPPPCRFEAEPRQWTGEALTAWDRLDRERLRLARPVTPVITLFDQDCAYTLTPDRRGDFRVGARRYRTRAMPHGGRIRLPDGNSVPAERGAFAAPMSNGEMFFMMALPPLWRANVAEGRDPRLLSMVAFMHEFAHTQQGEGIGERIDALLTRGLPQDANDDIVQDRFASRPGYTAAWVAERDLFYEAAQAPDARQALALLSSAAERMAARRERWLSGEEAVYAEADNLFLTMEGSGNWAAWTWLVHPQGGRMSPAEATAFVRGGARLWSQDQGLAVMLTLERLTPDWPRLAFGPDGVSADELIERALNRQ